MLRYKTKNSLEWSIGIKYDTNAVLKMLAADKETIAWIWHKATSAAAMTRGRGQQRGCVRAIGHNIRARSDRSTFEYSNFVRVWTLPFAHH